MLLPRSIGFVRSRCGASLFQRCTLHGTAARLAPKGGGKKGKAGKAADAASNLTAPMPINIYKEGGDVELKPDSEYPEWVFTMMDPKPSLTDYVNRPKEYWVGLEAGKDVELAQEARHYEKLHRRQRIKDSNAQGGEL